jgi:hypothetical protein
VSSGYNPAKDEPEPDEILEALREAVADIPRLAEMPAEEVAGSHPQLPRAYRRDGAGP